MVNMTTKKQSYDKERRKIEKLAWDKYKEAETSAKEICAESLDRAYEVYRDSMAKAKKY